LEGIFKTLFVSDNECRGEVQKMDRLQAGVEKKFASMRDFNLIPLGVRSETM
jgi:hypothetical protein